MIISRANCFTLLIDSLEKDLIPDLATDQGKIAGKIAVDSLKELYKYEHREPKLAQKLLPKGITLGNEAITILAKLSIDSANEHAEKLNQLNNFTQQCAHLDPGTMAIAFNHLMAILDTVVGILIRSRDKLIELGLNQDMSSCLANIAEWELSFYQPMMEDIEIPKISGPAPKPLTQEILEKRLRQSGCFPTDISITLFQPISGGMSKQSFLVSTEDSLSGKRDMIARKSDLEQVFTHGNYVLSNEYPLLQRLHQLGLPVAKPYCFFEGGNEFDGDCYLMEKMPGSISGTVFEAFAPISEPLFLELAEFFAKLHAIKIDQFEDYIRNFDQTSVLNETIEACVHRRIIEWQKWWETLYRSPSPGEAHMFSWLLNNVPKNSNPPVLAHADCSIHNFLAENDHITAVLDWENSHFGDPAEDLAYVKNIVSQHMDWNKFVQHYLDCGGQPIDESTLNYYCCLTGFTNYIGANKMFSRLEAGTFSDIRMLPVALTYFPRFLESCIVSTRSQ